MQKIEYKIIEFVQKEKKGMGIRVTASSEYYPRFIDGVELKDWESLPSFHEYLISLGEEGWQYAGSGPAVHAGFSAVLFRPLG